MLTAQQIIEARSKLGLPANGSQQPQTNSGNLKGQSLFDSISASVQQSTPVDNNPNGKASIFGAKPTTTISAKVGDQLKPLVSSEIGLGQDIAVPKNRKDYQVALQHHNQVEQALIDRISQSKAVGQDTSKLVSALSMLQSSKPNEKQFGAEKVSKEKLAGDIIGTGIDVATAGFLPGGSKIAGTIAKQGIKDVALAGAKAGAGYGAAQGLASGLQQEKTTGGVIKETVGGAVAGGLLGSAGGVAVAKAPELLNAAKSGISKVTSNITEKNLIKQEGFVLDLVSPKATDKVKQQALKEGRVTEQGLLNASKILPSKRDIQVAETVKGIVSSKNSVNKNIDAISKTVSEINTGVKAYVAENKVPFNGNQLKTKLNKGKDELKLIFASDKQAEKTYDAVVKEFMKHVKRKDTAGLLDARQEFDKIPAIRKLLESQGLGENVKKEIVLTARTKANEYVASLLPKGNKYRETLLKESKMIEAIGNIAEKNSKEIGKNRIQTLTEEYPILKWLAGGLVGSAGIGVGGAIIGS